MSGNYPAGVTDNDPYFDMPNAHEDDEDDGPLCLGCHDDCEVDSDGYCDECSDERDGDL
jgi:hypothetical protein